MMSEQKIALQNFQTNSHPAYECINWYLTLRHWQFYTFVEKIRVG